MKIIHSRQNGATLIEVLVAMIVLAIGLLGIAGLQTTSVQANQSSAYRSQATLLAADIVDRMRANRALALSGSYTTTSFPTSSSTNTVTGTRAEKDKAEWLNQLALALPDGTATINLDSTNNLFTIAVRWNDRRGRIKTANDDGTDDLLTFTYRARL